LKKCNGVNKSDDDAPSLKKTFELSESITNNVERCKRPRVSFLYLTLLNADKHTLYSVLYVNKLISKLALYCNELLKS
jgi:hypothetical protein